MESKYWAFISYSHKDQRWAAWLHRSLETYPVPRRLVGRESRDGKIPRRISPVFLDRDELPTSSDLGGQLKEALRTSRYLIVICSPTAATSRWVNEEIKFFKSLGREDRVLALIVDGEPNACDRPGGEAVECFPEALRYSLGADGETRGARVEPIAADARPGKDGRTHSKLKLLAGILGVNFDDLRLRDRRRLRQRRVIWITLALLACSILAGVWLWQQNLRIREERSVKIDQDIELGRQEWVAGNALRALPYLSEAYGLGDTRGPLRFLLGQAMQSIDRRVATYPAQNNPTSGIFYMSDDQFIVRYRDSTVTILSTNQAKAKVRLDPAIFPIHVVKPSPDGRLLATVSHEKAFLVDAQTGTIIHQLTGHEMDIKSVQFSADGRYLVTASVDNTAKVWDVGTGALRMTLVGHEASLDYAGFSEDGSRIVTASMDGSAKVWNAQNGSQLLNLEGKMPLASAAFSPEADLATLYGGDGSVTVRDCRTGATVTDSQTFPGMIDAWFDYPKKGDLAIVREVTGHNIEIRDARTQNLLGVLRGHSGTISQVTLSPDRSQVLTTSWDGTCKIWDARTATLLFTFTVANASTPVVRMGTYAYYSRDGQSIALTNGSGVINIWNVQASKPLLVTDVTPAANRVFFSKDNRQVVATGPEGISAVEITSGQRFPKIDASDNFIKYVQMGGEGNRWVAATSQGYVNLWDVKTGGKIAQIDGQDFRLNPDGTKFIATAHGGDAAIYNALDGHLLMTLHGKISAAAFVPGGNTVLSIGPDYELTLWDGETGRVLQTWLNGVAKTNKDPLIPAPIFSPDGKWTLIVQGEGGTIWDVANASKTASTSGYPEFGILSARFSADGTRLITAGEDGSARIWSIPEGKLLTSLTCGSNFVSSAELTADGSVALSATEDKGIAFWDAGNGRILAQFDGSNASLSSDGRSMVTLSRGVNLIDVGWENRSPAAVADLIRKNDPWQLLGENLVEQPASTLPP